MSLEWYLCVINLNLNNTNTNNNTNNTNNNNNNIKDCKCVKYDYNYCKNENFNLNILGNNLKTILIPVCKYTPTMFHKYILNYKLDNSIFFEKIKIINSQNK
jgi:hypothetical protein